MASQVGGRFRLHLRPLSLPPPPPRQGRVTDHRIHLTLHDLESVLEGGEGLERLVEALRAAREEEALKRLAEGGKQ